MGQSNRAILTDRMSNETEEVKSLEEGKKDRKPVLLFVDRETVSDILFKAVDVLCGPA